MIPILTTLKALNNPQIEEYAPYMLDQELKAEKQVPGMGELNITGYDMTAFKQDNGLVMSWFHHLKNEFDQWICNLHAVPVGSIDVLSATGSRSFNASYTESDLECAIVSDKFEYFLDFCRFLNEKYGSSHDFTAIKTLAGLPLLIVKGKDQKDFQCPALSQLYPGKMLPQLEVTFRHPQVHELIQKAGSDFFASLSPAELKSYVDNKRYIELMHRHAPKDVKFDGNRTLVKFFIDFKGALAYALKCLPAGKLQDTPDFNKEVFANCIKPKMTLSDASMTGLTLHSAQIGSANKGTEQQPQYQNKY